MNIVRKLIELDNASPKRILIAGDCMVDHYICGTLTPSQDGCDKFVVSDDIKVPGGAENAERSLSNWNSVKLLYGYVEPITIKRRWLVDNKIVFREDRDSQWPRHKQEFAEELRNDTLEAIGTRGMFSAVLLCDYDKGFLTPEFIRQVADLCRERGIPCVADAKREPKTYEGCILKCNDAYLDKFNSEVSPAFVPNYVITHGARTPVICNGEKVCARMRDKHPVRCISHVGAGDCFGAHLTLALAHGFSLEDAAAIAHSAGRVYVQRPHNHPPTPEEIARDFEGLPLENG